MLVTGRRELRHDDAIRGCSAADRFLLPRTILHTSLPSAPLLVLDTNVALDWIAFDDVRVLPLAEAIERGALQVVTDAACSQELKRALGYAQIGLDAQAQERAYERYCAHARGYAGASDVPQPSLPQCADADDQKFLLLAWRARADYLLTRDKALLTLAPSVGRLGRFAVLAPDAFLRLALGMSPSAAPDR